MTAYAAQLAAAKEAAIKAGRIILEVYNGKADFGVETKEDGSPVTNADRWADEAIRGELRQRFQDYALLSEEAKDDKSRMTREHVWIIDPLDGTKGFIAQNGEFAVNIGLVRNGVPVLGVVYVPVTDELYFSAEGGGAHYQQGSKREVLSVSLERRIEKMRVVISRSRGKIEREIAQSQFGEIRVSESSIKGCLVARGEAEIFFKLAEVGEWDVCAVDALVTEAGGIMTDLQGNRIRYNQENTRVPYFLMSNNVCHQDLLGRINAYQRSKPSR